MRLIDADELFKELSEKGKEFYEYELFDSAYGISCAKTIVFVSPTIDAKPIRHGRWINVSATKRERIFKCSVCRNTLDFDGVNAGRGDANYCPNCGAKMDEKENNNDE
ncbi:MAG: hypothetical protein KBT27_05155 [Prevotellaceae bacterium]|nr:hypothetical protein [Candidatus Faecinaster equi]